MTCAGDVLELFDLVPTAWQASAAMIELELARRVALEDGCGVR